MKSNHLELKVDYVQTSYLKPADYNPRTWSDAAMDQLKASIGRFGIVDPFLVNQAEGRHNILIGGHMRLQASKKLGIKTVPVVYLNIPDLEKEKELNLRLNRNTGEWDLELLKEFDVGLLFDVGFNDTDLSEIWDDALEIEDDSFDVTKELKKIKNPKAKEGELYQLGKHRLICGDSTDPNVVKRLLDGHKADMIYSDPPYNIALDYNKGIGTQGKYGGSKVDDQKSNLAYREFLKKCMQNALEASKDNCHVFFWCDQNYIGLVQGLYKTLGLDLRRVCLWIKNNSNVTPQVAFNKCYEPCVYAVKGKPYLSKKVNHLNEVLNKEVGTGNQAIEDIMGLMDIWLVKRLPTNAYQHPTEKPPTLHEKPLRRCTQVGDSVLDLFGGSGSTLIACEQMKRVSYIAEIDPVFVDLILKRFEKLTGTKPKLLT